MKKINGNKLCSMVLAVTLILGCAVPVSAEAQDNLNGKTENTLTIEGENTSEDRLSGEEIVSTEQDLNAAEEDDSDQLYGMQEEEKAAEQMAALQASDADNEIEAPDSVQTGAFSVVPNEDQSGYVITLKDIYVPDGFTNIAYNVWSETGGRDDDQWFDAVKTDRTASLDLKMASMKHFGNTHVDVYVGLPQGGALCVYSGTFEADEPAPSGEPTGAYDSSSGNFTLTVPGFQMYGELKAVAFAVTSPSGQVKWYDAIRQSDGTYVTQKSLSVFANALGTYRADLYYTDVLGRTVMNGSTSFSVGMPEVEILPEKTDDGIRITTSGVTLPGGVRNVAVCTWSLAGGGDDTRWLDSATSGTTSICTIPLSGYKHYGTVHVDVYAATLNGQVVCLGGTDYDEIKAPSLVGEITAQGSNTDGSFTIKVPGFDDLSAVAVVAAQIFNPSGVEQWTELVRQSDGSYVLTSNITGYGSLMGTYKANIWVKDFTGNVTCAGDASFSVNMGDVKITSQKNSTGYYVEAKNLAVPGGLRNVALEVWSKTGGKDDDTWLDASLSGTTAGAQVNQSLFKHYGTCYVQVYAASLTGRVYMLGETTFEFAGPAGTNLDVSFDNTAGTFTLTATVENISGARNFAAEIWVGSDRKYDKWYDMTIKADGTVVFTGNIADFGYYTSDYNAHVYVRDIYGTVTDILNTTFSFPFEQPDTSVLSISDNVSYLVTMGDIQYPGGLSSVAIEVSNDEGVKTTRWCDLFANGDGTWSGEISLNVFKSLGSYTICFYGRGRAGDAFYICTNSDLSIDSNAQVNLAVMGSGTSSFRCLASVASTDTAVRGMRFTAWTQADKSDVYTYTGSANNDGTYYVDIDPMNHKGNLGTYHITAQAVFENATSKDAGETTYEFEQSDYLVAAKTELGVRTIYLKNPLKNYAAVSYAVWSNSGDQDDIKWYTATKNSDGDWQATVNYADFKHAGLYWVHVYAKETVSSTDQCIMGSSFLFNDYAEADSWWDKDIAHALGAINGKVYSNSKEAFLANYAAGFRSFELDALLTSDGEIACYHTWQTGIQPALPSGYQPTLAEFLASPIYGIYTPMTFSDACYLLNEYQDAWIVLDTKDSDAAGMLKIMTKMYETAKSLGLMSVMNRVVLYLYSEDTLNTVTSVYDYKNYVLALYQMDVVWKDNPILFAQMCAWCVQNKVTAVEMYHNYTDATILSIAKQYGLNIYLHTIDNKTTAQNYLNQGYTGVISNTIKPGRACGQKVGLTCT